ncbi:hypothetical protein [Arcobacter arenosus]|jgi:hypothetical protein|uniref:Uncharacterized protein n=1 Tax=Arcobacter arenosus TaxID=2576037 RepID=A0A5R8Y217_9BACT|nr:hypothetical protein [Arcobacter arenosus]TLP39129.1 hypothetical protein FDK22_04450 [Arcobacter arenosus]
MFSNFLGKKDNKEPKQVDSEKIDETIVIQKEEPKGKESEPLVIKTNTEDDFDKKQCIDMGLDIKENVKRASHAFFNSKNKQKADAYLMFEEYISSLSSERTRELQKMKYLDFIEEEEKIFTMLKNGFAQSVSKGASLDENSRKIVDFIFGDIKKFPSKGHRYWYYKTYIWQKRETD